MFIAISNVKAFDNTLKIYDYAQILTETEEIKLKEEIDKYIKNYNKDMVIVTVKYYLQNTSQEYMYQFYNQNKFGVGSNKDGIMLVIDLKDSKDLIDIRTFGFANELYSDIELNDILNQVNSKKDYYDKLITFIEYSDKYIKTSDEKVENTAKNILLVTNWLGILMPSLIIPTIVIVVGLLKNKNVKKLENASYYVKKDSIVINKKSDEFVTTNTKKTRINNK